MKKIILFLFVTIYSITTFGQTKIQADSAYTNNDFVKAAELMKHKNIYDLLKTLNIPVAYDHFKTEQNTPPVTPPFLAYREISPETIIMVDNCYGEFVEKLEITDGPYLEKSNDTMIKEVQNMMAYFYCQKQKLKEEEASEFEEDHNEYGE